MSCLPIIWLGIIGFFVIMYVILDGFTLGIGILAIFLNEQQRNITVSVLLPTWDGNQTWLVLGMASLYGAFPLAFSVLLPALYLPLLVMVVALLLRGVAFEFRLKAAVYGRKIWDGVFFASALTATLAQGFILGQFIQGFKSGLINSFSMMTGISLVVGYCLLGATRLILKTQGDIQAKMFRVAFTCVLLLMSAIFIVSVWTPFVYPLVQQRWFNLTYIPWLAILPLITAMTFMTLLWALHRRQEVTLYWLSILLFLCPYVGFIISLFPFIVPYQITLWQAAAPDTTLKFILVGAVIMLPILLLYTGYAYRIFRGKVNESIHY